MKSNLSFFPPLGNYVFGFISNDLNLALCPEDFPLKVGYLNIYLIQKSAKEGQRNKTAQTNRKEMARFPT